MPKKNSPALNLRNEANFFVCDVLVPKDDMASMEHPIFSLSTKADTKIRHYEHNGNSIKITPSVMGLATIHDKDILIYCISQIVARIKEGQNASRTVRMKARDLLLSTGRSVGGRDYKLLKEAFERLRGTSITTDIKTNGQTISKGFGLIDQWEIVTEDKKNAKMLEIEVTISEWMYNSVLGKEILTISKDYFNIRGALDRRIYELARKHCGKQREWRIDIENLKKKCGSHSSDRYFKFMLKEIAEKNDLPDYQFQMNDKTIVFQNRDSTCQTLSPAKTNSLHLEPETYEKARLAAPDLDIYALEKEWRQWHEKNGNIALKSPDGAFIAFCRKRSEGSARTYSENSYPMLIQLE